MKHPVRDRLLMMLYALVSLCAAAVLIAVVFGQITPDMLSSAEARIQALSVRTLNAIRLVAAAVLTVLGLSLIAAMFPPKKKRSSTFAIQHNENGTVRISLKTIDALVQKCLAQHSELKVVTSSLFSDEETVRVDVHIVLLADISMPLAISALQKQITKYVEACSGVNVCEVRVFVDGAMTGDEKAAQSKYALPASVLAVEPLGEETAEETADVLDIQEEEMIAAQEPVISEEPVAVEEEAPVEETAPAVEEVPSVEEAPAAGEEQKASADEPEAEAQEAPAEQEAFPVQEPEVEKKKIFGLFSKK